MTVVDREHLLKYRDFTPFCHNHKCVLMPRTIFNGVQFECPSCHAQTKYSIRFISDYKEKWGLE